MKDSLEALTNMYVLLKLHNLQNDDDFIVINVEGYACVALVTNEWEPIEICDRVFPFDGERIYPMQEIEQKIYFKTFH